MGSATSGSSTATLNDLGDDGTYHFYFKVSGAGGGASDCSRNFLTYVLDATPPATPGIALESSGGGNWAPTVTVSPVSVGDTVNLYSDSSCETLAATPKVASETSLSFVANTLEGGNGVYQFYARATDPTGNVSPCSGSPGTYTLTLRPVFFSLTTISSGYLHTCALKSDSTVSCWGAGGNGRLGDGATTNRNYPVGVISGQGSSDLLSGIVQVSLGSQHTCALKSDNTVSCWGSGTYGRLGDGTSDDRNYPVGVIAGQGSSDFLRGIVQVSSGGQNTCALKSDNTVSCWGAGGNGRLGDGTNVSKSYPVRVISGQGSSDLLSSIIQVSLGGQHTCALKSDGMVSCWGSGAYGQLGDGTAANRNYPVGVIAGQGSSDLLSGIVLISSGGQHTCALKSDSTVSCWGSGTYGRLGDGISDDRNYPVGVIAGQGSSDLLSGIVQVSSGQSHTCALKSDGTVSCWGAGYSGQLGNGATTNKNYPVGVISGQGSSALLSNVVQISSGVQQDHTCAQILTGEVKCWGQGTHGRLGNGGSANKNYPVTVVVDDSTVGSFNVGTYRRSYSCGVGNINCDLGGIELALGTGTSSPSASNAAPNIDVSGIAAGETFTLYSNDDCETQVGNVLTVDGTVKCQRSRRGRPPLLFHRRQRK